MTATPILVALSCTGLGTAVLAEAAGAEPWWIAAIVIPLAGFAAWLVRWILTRQDERDKAIAAREEKREAREEKRAEQSEVQTRAMQECVVELRRLNEQQINMPNQIVERLRHEDLVTKRTA